MPRTRPLALVVAAVVLLAGAPDAVAKRHSTCAKPTFIKLRFKSGGIKLFYDIGEAANTRWYICTPKMKLPHRWYDTHGYGYLTTDEKFKRQGDLITFSWLVDADYAGGWELGWLNVKTLRSRVVQAVEDEDVEGYALGPGGAMVYIDEPAKFPQTISFAPAKGKARFLLDLPDGGADPKSLRMTSDAVLWKMRTGEQKSVPLTYKPPWWAETTEYQIPTKASKPVFIAAGPDGAVWFTEYAGNKIGRVTADGQVSEFKIPTATSMPDGIAAGSDGALWFTEGGGNKIGRITTDGAITEFKVPTAKSGPAAITAGPDGALWFTERLAKKVARITTAGQITEFKVPGRNEEVVAITTGPDGALWFSANGYHAEYSSGGTPHRIMRMTTDGTVTAQYKLKDFFDAPGVMAPGPDGAVWFTEARGFDINRIAPDGTVKSFDSGGGPTGITAGSDGAMWFALQSDNRIARLTTDLSFSSFRLPNPDSAPFGITSGPDGALWFTEYSRNRIGRMPPDVAKLPLGF